ncbi:MAG: TrwC protein [Bradyrhizobium sp.]|nr:TrwC protein [Bradyrhizobium sp.]
MIHPRRLKGTAANIGRYYTVGDYYTKGVDEHSEWGGLIADELGLTGKVDPVVFRELLEGKVAGQQLGRHRAGGEIDHHPGWDFAVNAPKSVSIMALVSGDARILAAHEAAVGSALGYLEEHAALRHRVEGEIVHQTTGRLIFARFTEHASRELDPHLHTHVVVMNITNREPGSVMASLETRAMFAEQMVAGQVYRNDLAHRLREVGYDIDTNPRTGLFEIRGVPADLMQAMSQRAEQIDAHAREHGLEGQAARRKSFYETRGAKEKVGLDELRARWATRAAEHLPALISVRATADTVGERDLPPHAADAGRAMLFGIRQAETGEAVNNLGRMLRIGLASHVGEVRLDDIRPLVEAHQARTKLLATTEQTGDAVLTRGRTTRGTARLEIALSEHLSLALNDARPVTSEARLAGAMRDARLNQAQEAALFHIALSTDRVLGVHGVAGAGKSTLVRSLVEAADPDIRFTALAPTSSAAANLGQSAGIEARTVASLVAGTGRGLTDRDVLVLDEAGQLGNRQALRVLELSRRTGARLILLGDNKQTGAIEQGKAFWLLQRLGLPTAELTESVRQETRAMKAAVTKARAGDYASSLANLDKVVSGDNAGNLARQLVAEWIRLKPENRATTNILVLENTTRLIVNARVRDALKVEGAIAAEETRLSVLTPSGMSDQEKRFARFYSGGQVVKFSADNAGLGIARDAEYRVVGTGHDGSGRQIVRLVDEHGRTIRWDPRLGRASQVNVFKSEERDLARGDRIQWRLVDHKLDLKNAERGTVEALKGTVATIRWDRGKTQDIDLGIHRTWDHGYAETVYSAQSKTYARAYVLAPVNSPLVTGQNYYTAITRARFGVKLWTEDEKRLVERLSRRSGEKTSSLEGLGRLDRDGRAARERRHGDRLEARRQETREEREERKVRMVGEPRQSPSDPLHTLADRIAGRAQSFAETIDRYLGAVLGAGRAEHSARSGEGKTSHQPPPQQQPGKDR